MNKCDNNVCQLRLDLINFVMRPPESTDHKCQDDQFIVSGSKKYITYLYKNFKFPAFYF